MDYVRSGRTETGHPGSYELSTSVALAILGLVGTVLFVLDGAVFYTLWSLLQAVLGV